METICTAILQCSGNGECIDLINVKDDVVMPVNTRLGSVVALPFEHTSGCRCHQGFGRDDCQEIINACGYRPCAAHQVCTPTDLIPKGHLCHCNSGFAGEKCDIDVTKCNNLSCYHPIRPFSFRGKSYVQYTASHLGETSSMQLSMYFRTRNPVGVLSYTAGSVDYGLLEVIDGYIQYRWDCGSGEGVVRSSFKNLNDNKWHFVNVTRKGTISTLSLDGVESSSAAPGDNDVLNIESDYMFLGARVKPTVLNPDVECGYVGCIDEVMLNGAKLPLTLATVTNDGTSPKRFVNVELTCPESLPVPGVCGSHPCLNGGTCSELNRTHYGCICSNRYSGQHCEVDEAPCSSSPCLNDGVCVVSEHSFSCKCPVALSGKRCEYGVFCNPNPCQNGGRCEEGSSGPICKCHHFTGLRCHRDIDECKQSPCQNGGTCLNFYGGFRCLCPSNVSGLYCTEAIARGTLDLDAYIEELIVIIAVFLAFALVIVCVVVWQRKRWNKKKQHQKNNRVKLMSHVKNDLRPADRPNRNSKICNVEADQLHMQYPSLFPQLHMQYPSLPARSLSFVSSADESLKQWAADVAVTLPAQPGMELDILIREPRDGMQDPGDEMDTYFTQDSNVKRPTDRNQPHVDKMDQDTQQSILYFGDQIVDCSHKPYDHHNNLNDVYRPPVTGSSLTVNSDVRPTTPLVTFQGDRVLSPPRRCDGDVPSGEVWDGRVNANPSNNWDARPKEELSDRRDSDADGSRSGSSGMRAGHEDEEEPEKDDSFESRPLLRYTSQQLPEVVLCTQDAPGISLIGNDTSTSRYFLKDDASANISSSFDTILKANNMSLDSSDDAINETPFSSVFRHPSVNINYNIVTEDISTDKITNVAPESVQTLSKAYIPKIRNDRCIRTEPRRRSTKEIIPTQNRLGNPRSRKPIIRGDYGRVSDLSFLSYTDCETETDGFVSDFQDSDDEQKDENTYSENMGPNTFKLCN